MTPQPPLVLAEKETPFWGFGEVLVIMALAVVVFGVTGSIAYTFLKEDARLGYWAVLEEFAAYLVIFGIIKAFFFWQGKPLLQSLAFVKSAFNARTLIYTGFALLALSVAISALARTPQRDTPFQEMLEANNASRIVIAIFGISFGPLAEELIFRGLLQPVFANALGVFPGILLTSVLFGSLHLQQNAGMWQSGLVISIAGFGFGVIRHITGSTRASTLTHIAYNFVPCLGALLQPANK